MCQAGADPLSGQTVGLALSSHRQLLTPSAWCVGKFVVSCWAEKLKWDCVASRQQNGPGTEEDACMADYRGSTHCSLRSLPCTLRPHGAKKPQPLMKRGEGWYWSRPAWQDMWCSNMVNGACLWAGIINWVVLDSYSTLYLRGTSWHQYMCPSHTDTLILKCINKHEEGISVPGHD